MGERHWHIGNICAREEGTVFSMDYIPIHKIPKAMCERNRLDSCQCQKYLQVKDGGNDSHITFVSPHEKEILQVDW